MVDMDKILGHSKKKRLRNTAFIYGYVKKSDRLYLTLPNLVWSWANYQDLTGADYRDLTRADYWDITKDDCWDITEAVY